MPTKAFLHLSPGTATYPPPPVPPFLLRQNLSPNDNAGNDIMKLMTSYGLGDSERHRTQRQRASQDRETASLTGHRASQDTEPHRTETVSLTGHRDSEPHRTQRQRASQDREPHRTETVSLTGHRASLTGHRASQDRDSEPHRTW